MYFSVRGFGCALFYYKGERKMILIVAIVALFVLIPLWIVLTKKSAKDGPQEALSLVMTILSWIIGIAGVIGFIILGVILENTVLAIAGSIASVLFMLILLGLAKIIGYLCKIHETAKTISSQLASINDARNQN